MTKTLFIGLFALLIILSAVFANRGFDKLREMRQLERIPRTEVLAVIAGEVNLAGRAQVHQETVTAPDTGAETLYYRFVVERRESDSDGTHWRTVRQESRTVPFLLRDESGEILLAADPQVVRAGVKRVRHQGQHRYTEYRIDPGDAIFLFGYAEIRDGRPVVRFGAKGHYTPMISQQEEAGVRSGIALLSMLFTWLALGCATFAVFCLCQVLHIHHAAIYLSLMTLVVFLGLTGWGWKAAREDLAAASHRFNTSEKAAREIIQAGLEAHGRSWDGDWANLGSVDFTTLPQPARERLRRIRLDLWRTEGRARATWDHWPERWVASLAGLPAPSLPILPEAERVQVAKLETSFEPTRIRPLYGWIVALAGFALALYFSRSGFRFIRTKRMVENIPTSKTAGVAYGVTELRGKIELSEDRAALVSPVTATRCVYYRHVIEEERKTRNSTKWRKIDERKECIPFLCRDGEGHFLIDPAGAEVITRAPAVYYDAEEGGVLFGRGRRLRHTEHRLDVDGPLYALGCARINQATGASLYLTDEEGLPYILSDLSENEIMMLKARSGFLSLNLGFLAGLAMALAWAGGVGAFSGLSYLSAALIGPVYLGGSMAVLIYNDLIFLRRRVETAWSNIGVSLRKRADLVPNLEKVLQAYLGHERDLQEQLTRFRGQAQAGIGMDPRTAAQFVALEQVLMQRLVCIQENYPELKASDGMLRLHRSLVELENEVAFMRQGYNNAVERNNTRVGQIPEVFIAKTFGFQSLEHFQIQAEVRELPRMDSLSSETPRPGSTGPAPSPLSLPQEENKPLLLMEQGPGDMRPLKLTEPVVSLGRDDSCTIQVPDSNASRRHCQIEQRETGLWIVDLDSSNGTFVNEKRVEQARLNDGDIIRVGRQRFQVGC